MTSADAPQRKSGALARGWRSFRRWRRSRPFWGGLLTFLSGLQIYASTQLSIGDIQLRIGVEGFLSYLIPLVMLLCGLLIWFTPQQRIFYGVIAAVVAVYSFIGVNFGGFFIGMLLGIVGGALAAAWTPVKREPAQPSSTEPSSTDTGGPADHGPDATVDELFTGPLTDVLPTPVNPLHEPVRDEEKTQRLPRHQETEPTRDQGNGPDANGQLPRRTPRLFVITLVPLMLAALALADLHGIPAASAAPVPYPTECLSPTPSKSANAKSKAKAKPKASASGATSSGGGAEASPSPSPSRTPSASPSAPASSTADSGDPVGDIVGGIVGGIAGAVGDLLGIGDDPTPSPSATPSPTPTPSPSTTGSSGGAASSGGRQAATTPSPTRSRKSATPTPSASGSCGTANAKVRAADEGLPKVQKVPDQMTGTKLHMTGFAFDKVTELDTVDPDVKVRVLQFSMDESVTNNFELRIPGPEGTTISLKSSELTVRKVGKKVLFFCSRFTGKLQVAGFDIPIPLTFTPDFPPPLTLDDMTFTDIDIQLVFVDAEFLHATELKTTVVE